MKKARKYEDGGSFDWGGLAGGALSILGTAYKLADVDTDSLDDKVDAEVEAMKQLQVKPANDSLDGLVRQRLGYRGISTDFDVDDYNVGPTDSEKWTGVLGGVASGAKTGASIGGGWGALAGALIGGGLTWLGAEYGQNTAEKAAENAVGKLRGQAVKTNTYNIGSFKEAANTAYTADLDRQKKNIIAYGGPLGISLLPVRGAIDYMQNEELLSSLGENMTKNNNSRTSMPMFAFGGALPGYGGDWSNGLNFIKAGKRHEQNPIGGVPMGMAQDGTPNLVEEGEVVWNDYVFSNRINVPKAVRDKFKLKGKDNMTFAEAVEKAQKASAERPNDPIEKRTLDTLLAGLMQEQETIRQKKAEKAMAKAYALGGHMFLGGGYFDDLDAFDAFDAYKRSKKLQITSPTISGFPQGTSFGNPLSQSWGMTDWSNFGQEEVNRAKLYSDLVSGNPLSLYYTPKNAALKDKKDNGEKSPQLPTSGWETALRYAPVVGGIGTVFSDLMGWTNKPDYQYADAIDAAAERATSGYTHVSPTMLGDYLAYNPFDRLFYANELGAQQAATRRGILNLSNGNRGTALASLLAADYNGNIGLGKLYREGEEYNLAQRQKVAEFNRATNMYNSEADLKAQMANAEMDKAKANLLYEAALKSNLMRQQEDQTSNAARAANIANLFDNLGNLGIDAYNRYDRNALINAGVFGTLSQKPQGVSDADWEAYQKVVKGAGSHAHGGKLKRKKGLTI